MQYMKNPIVIKGRFIEKEELDEWIYKFREAEYDFVSDIIQIRCKSEAEQLFEIFTKRHEILFENCFGAKITIFKKIIFNEGYYNTVPAYIKFS